MAMRHLRRIQEQASKAKEPGQLVKLSEDDAEEDEGAASNKAPFNPFDLLSDEERPEQDADGSDKEAAIDAALHDDKEESEQQLPQAVLKPSPKKLTAAAKKKKKSKAAKPSAAAGDDEGPKSKPTKAVAAKSVEDDIEAIVRELNLTVGGAASSGPSNSVNAPPPTSASTAPSVLCVDVKALRGDEELRRIFGSDVVAAVDRQDRAAAAEARRVGAATRGLPGRRRGLALKRGWLVAPKEHWPPSEGGLSMEIAGTTKSGAQLFRYVHSPAYRETQARFYRCQASYDPTTIAALLQQAPYHVDSLLAMHDLYRHMGENSSAEEMLDRALWSLEAAWHPSFQPATATCRLDYSVEENRPLFGALFRHVTGLSRRGCHRAALEVCKLLLALEPGDPLGGLLLVDYLAVRASRYDWLQRFVRQFEGNRALALLPNYAFALPMAAHRQQQDEKQQQRGAQRPGQGAAERAQPGASSSGAVAGESGSASTSPHEVLVDALLLHPVVLPRLVAKLQDKGAAKESYWKELLGRGLFAKASEGGSASLLHLVGLYVERSGELWKPPEMLALLRRAAEEAADIADGKVVAASGLMAADWRAMAREAFPPSTANEYRHLRLADFSDAVNALPREEVEAAVAAGGGMRDVQDALEDIQEQILAMGGGEHDVAAAAAALAAAANGGGGGRGAAPIPEEELRGANPLLMLLRSMLPWVNAGQQPDYGAQAGEGGPAAGGAAVALPAPPPPEYDEDDGHLDDEDGMVRQVRRQ